MGGGGRRGGGRGSRGGRKGGVGGSSGGFDGSGAGKGEGFEEEEEGWKIGLKRNPRKLALRNLRLLLLWLWWS